MAIFLSLSNIFVYCFLGKFAFECFDKMPGSLYDSNWYKLPNRYWKYLVIIIGNMQTPLYYCGFGVAILDLETFTKVCIGSKSFVENQDFKVFQDYICVWICPKKFLHICYYTNVTWVDKVFFFQVLNTVYSYYMIFKTFTQ